MKLISGLLLLTILIGGSVSFSLGQTANPTMMFSFLLNEMKVQPDGTVYFGFLRVMNLSMPTRKAGCRVCIAWPYNAEDGGTLTSILRQDGRELGKQKWRAKQEAQNWYLETDGQATKVPGTGNYEMTWEVEGKPFFKFAFRVVQGPRGLRAAGDWDDYGYLIFDGSNPSGQLRLTTWLIGDSIAVKNRVPELKIIRDSDGKTIAESNLNGVPQGLLPDWKRINFLFNQPKPQSGPFRGNDLLAADGGYTLEFKLDGEVYGRYKFDVKGKQIVRAGRQAPNADAMTLIEGGSDAWFIRKS